MKKRMDNKPIKITRKTELEWKDASLCVLLEKLQDFFGEFPHQEKTFHEIQIRCEIDGLYHAYFQKY